MSEPNPLETQIKDVDRKVEKLKDELKTASSDIAALKALLNALPPKTEEGLLSNRRTRFQENGNWARHYSAVRMTVTIFLVGLSLGILSFKWEPKGQPLANPPELTFRDLSGWVWSAAVILFVAFTTLTYNDMTKARNRNLPDGAPTNRRPLRPRWESASWVVIIVTAIFTAMLFYLSNLPIWPFDWGTLMLPNVIRSHPVPYFVLIVEVYALIRTLCRRTVPAATLATS